MEQSRYNCLVFWILLRILKILAQQLINRWIHSHLLLNSLEFFLLCLRLLIPSKLTRTYLKGDLSNIDLSKLKLGGVKVIQGEPIVHKYTMKQVSARDFTVGFYVKRIFR